MRLGRGTDWKHGSIVSEGILLQAYQIDFTFFDHRGNGGWSPSYLNVWDLNWLLRDIFGVEGSCEDRLFSFVWDILRHGDESFFEGWDWILTNLNLFGILEKKLFLRPRSINDKNVAIDKSIQQFYSLKLVQKKEF